MPSPVMQALQFDRPSSDTSTAAVRAVEVPAPGPGQVLIRVTHAGINFKDVMARRGDAGYVRAWPFSPGVEVAGFVHETGAGVDALAIGEPVVAITGEGGLAQFALADARLTVPIPRRLDPEVAAAAVGAPLTAALLVNEFGQLRRGEVMLVHSAAGGVAHAAAQFARRAGASALIGTVGDASRVEAARRHGYDPVLVRARQSASELRAVFGGGVDLILDPQGTAMLAFDLELAAPGARVVLFGNASGEPVEPLPALGELMGANLALRGFSLAAMAARAPVRLAATLERVLEQLASGDLSLEVTVLDGLARAAQAQQALAEGRGETKYVIRIAQ